MNDGLTVAVGNLVAATGRNSRRPEPGDRWADLGLDSLDLLELVETSEHVFAVAIPDRIAARLRGPEDLIETLRSLGASGG